jgi:glycosyltransferase involved in cell wall biosynthesis
MKQANAGIYYHNCAEYVTGQVALWCRRNRRRFVFSAASDQDCDARLPGLPKWRERVLYRYGLRTADRVIVQTNKQRNMLLDGFGIDSTVLPMPCPGPTDLEYRPPADPTPSGTRVLWAGRIARVKRLEMLIDVARALPQVKFDVAGMPYIGDTYSENVMTEASRIPNIVLHGTVPRERMGGLYRNASLFCNTSEYEGFPNTFLEAWSHGLPIVSTVDPDGLIASRQLGLAAHDVAGIVNGIRAFIEHPRMWREMSVNSRSHYIANHTVEQVMRQFESVFTGTLENGRP